MQYLILDDIQVLLLTHIRKSEYVYIMKQIAKKFKALSDETRLRIISLLSNGELCVCDLIAALDLPQSTVSRHLATLRKAELVEDRRQGIWMYYRIAGADHCLPGNLLPLLQEQLSLMETAQQDLIRLQNYLRQKDAAACR